MSQHESLSAEFKPPPRLEPMETMEPYVPCWCQSGKKWKFCHKGRASETPLELKKLFHEMRLAGIKGYCAHPFAGSECGKIIAAHTIQRRGGLSKIAEAGHVLSVKDGAQRIEDNDGVMLPTKIGARSASTFAGFCGIHDNQMFAPIEKGVVEVDKESIFLFSFRAVAYVQFEKRSAIEQIEVQRKMDFGQSFAKQAAVQSYLHDLRQGFIRGLSDIDGWKEQYDRCVRANDYEDFRGYGCLFAETLPVASCGAFQPEVCFSGKQLQIISRGNAAFEHVAITLTPLQQNTLLTIGWFGAEGGPSETFARSFMALDNNAKANAAIHLAFDHMDNTYCTPTWWAGLDDARRVCLIRRSMTGIGNPGLERNRSSLVDLEPVLSNVGVLREAIFTQGPEVAQ